MTAFAVAYFVTGLYGSEVDPYNSYIRLEKDSTYANGQSKIKVWVYLYNSTGGAVPSQQFSLVSDNSSILVWSPGVTDSNGTGYGYVWSNTQTSGNVWVMADGQKIENNIADNGGMEFGSVAASSWTATPFPSWLTDYSSYASTGVNNSGKSSALNVTSQSNSAWYAQDIYVSTGTSYSYVLKSVIFSTGVYSDSGRGAMVYVEFRSADNLLMSSTSTVIVSGDIGWKSVDLNCLSYAGTKKATLMLLLENATGYCRFDGIQFIPSPSVFFKADTSAPGAITDLAGVSGPGNGQITLSWTEPGNDGYQWYNDGGYYVVKWFLAKNWPNNLFESGLNHTYTQSWVPLNPGEKHSEVLSGFPYGEDVCFTITHYDKAVNMGVSPTEDNKFSIKSKDNAVPIANVSCSNDFTSEITTAYPELSGSAPPGTYVWIQLDFNVVVTSITVGWDGKWSYKFKKRLEENEHSVIIYAEDGRGNRSAAVTYSFKINSVPTVSEVSPTYPNPVVISRNRKVKVPIKIKEEGKVELTIYNTMGYKVKELVKEASIDPGYATYEWDGRDDGGDVVNSGVYIIFYEIGTTKGTRSLTLIK